MKQIRNIDECDTEIEMRTVDENDEGTSCSEEEQEDDSDLKSLDWLISYRLPAFYSPLFDDSGTPSESRHSPIEHSSISKSDEDSVSHSKLPTLICSKQLQGRKHQQQQSNYSNLCWLYRILSSSPNRAVSLADVLEKFFELNTLERQHVFWAIEDDYMHRQQRSVFVQNRLREYFQGDAVPSSRKNGSKRAVLFTPYSKDASQRMKRANCDNELGIVTPSKRSLTAVITGEHCYQKSTSLLQERTSQK